MNCKSLDSPMPRRRSVPLMAILSACWACGARSELLEGDSVQPSEVIQLLCPTAPTDSRLPSLRPGSAGVIDGRAFAQGAVAQWKWSVLNDNCDAIVPNVSYSVENSDLPQLRFTPSRPAPYRIKLDVLDAVGGSATCTFDVAVEGHGLRVELCWNTSTSADLDLYLHSPNSSSSWYASSGTDVATGFNGDTCNPANCPAELRLELPRVSWGYADSPKEFCQQGPSAEAFGAWSQCPNPRSGVDNNQSLASGTSELIQLDNPRDLDRFRVMVQNFDNSPAEPHIFVYCGGRVAAALGPPAVPQQFVAAIPGGFGVMWRAADITTYVDDSGTVNCTAAPVASPTGTGDYVTIDDRSY